MAGHPAGSRSGEPNYTSEATLRRDSGTLEPSDGTQRRVPEDLAGLRLDQALARMFPEHSRSRLAEWLRDGHIRVDAQAAKPKQKIWGGERIDLAAQPTPEQYAAQAEAIGLSIVHEDDDVLVIDKPAGLVV